MLNGERMMNDPLGLKKFIRTVENFPMSARTENPKFDEN